MRSETFKTNFDFSVLHLLLSQQSILEKKQNAKKFTITLTNSAIYATMLGKCQYSKQFCIRWQVSGLSMKGYQVSIQVRDKRALQGATRRTDVWSASGKLMFFLKRCYLVIGF